MQLIVNGEVRDFPDDCDLLELIEKLALPARAVLVEHNGLALRGEEWHARKLKNGDQLEVIRIVAGG